MTRFSLKTLAAVLLAGLLGQAALAPSAQAGGRLSWTYAPSERDEATVLGTGLRLYSLYQGLRDGSIRQQGRNNSAGLAQNGRGNLGLIQQRGDGHQGTLRQTGDDNAYGLFQFGRRASDDIVQNGNGGSGATFSYGW
ncbi:hypothetical protein GCM10011390_38250 [Aureimonas endophytica]|uniref:Curlin n=1 Tax=Aureimonas endophytica TaxID=2027858 RepID=A0A916ZV15_9HYPH|nr:curlin [Aureimonas endophytica]GGE15480.1 hypothetical protein GCM10011390_38250 [Aureimonas endophytica]